MSFVLVCVHVWICLCHLHTHKHTYSLLHCKELHRHTPSKHMYLRTSAHTLSFLGSQMRKVLSLHAVARRLPSLFQLMEKMASLCSRVRSDSPVETFHTSTVLSNEAEARMFSAQGCHTTQPTLRWWPVKVTIGLSRFSFRPPSGISQTFTVQSSEQEAITLSLKGLKATSITIPLWPHTLGWFKSTRPG